MWDVGRGCGAMRVWETLLIGSLGLRGCSLCWAQVFSNESNLRKHHRADHAGRRFYCSVVHRDDRSVMVHRADCDPRQRWTGICRPLGWERGYAGPMAMPAEAAEAAAVRAWREAWPGCVTHPV